MKESPRGPFSAIKWFCKDGRVLAPQRLRLLPRRARAGSTANGATARSSCDRRATRSPTCSRASTRSKAVARPGFADAYAQLLIEKFLIASRRAAGSCARRSSTAARSRKRTSARRRASLLTAMAARDEWIGYRYPALRAGVRLLPHGADTASAQRVRNMAAAIADRDPAFQRLRVKIHGSPGRVRCRERARVCVEARGSRR